MPKDNLLEYVSRSPPSSHRIYCTLIPSSITVPSSTTNTRNRHHPLKYTLYVEHMGTLIPVLEATRRSSKLRPSFSISLPSDATSSDSTIPQTQRIHPEATSDDSTLDHGDNHNDTTIRCISDTESHTSLNTDSGIQLACKDDDNDINKCLPNSCSSEGNQRYTSMIASSRHIAEVSSHIINSKFRIQSISPKLPSDMGTITIKTSFLHIQPRKVIVHLPPQETDSGVDTDVSCEDDDSSSDESDIFADSDVSLDSLSSLEELIDTKQQINTESTVAKTPSNYHKSYTSRSTQQPSAQPSPLLNDVVIHSKTPTWNEQHMIYQLDFGGRVTTKSAKNFQLEMGKDQVRHYQ